jgi:hypothetical protein
VTEQPTPHGSAAPRPIPDLGFFAGPATRGTSAFGGAPVGAPSSSPAAGNRFDGAAGNQFGGAPAPVFGAPAPVFGAPAGPVYAGPSLERKPRSRPGFAGIRGGGIIGTVVLLVVLGIFGFGRLDMLAGFLAGDLEVPPTLGGLQRVTDPGVVAEAEKEAARLERKNSGDAIAASYSDGATSHLLVAQRVRIDIDEEFKDAGAGGLGQSVGESTCAAVIGFTMCLRTSRALSVMVLSSGTPQQAAAAIDEAWDKV